MNQELVLRLPDGSEKRVAPGTTPRAVAQSIGPGLARAAVAARLDGQIVELDRPLEAPGPFEILTDKSPDALFVLRHSAAHVLATAVRRLFPGAGIGFGPPIEDGFYYDFDVPRPFTPEDLEKIEAEMQAVVAADYKIEREVVSRAEATKRFAADPLKLERLAEIPDGETISVYRDGPFEDLCRGPHLAATGR
ncbi:MAG TPA: TGS domain-containing protein, partial [Gemmatimonadales bacterium]|nr:TGS domain-containing protein [Gemmatimonadales bacterium]